MDANATAATWKALADSYETARTKPDSFDVLMEFPAQLSLIGRVAGKRILDLATTGTPSRICRDFRAEWLEATRCPRAGRWSGRTFRASP